MDLSEVRAKIAALEAKITGYEDKIDGVKEKIRALEAEAFKLDQGRTLEAVDLAIQQNPEFAKVVAAMKEKIALEQKINPKPKNVGTGKRGRPRKDSTDAPSSPSPIEAPKSTSKKQVDTK